MRGDFVPKVTPIIDGKLYQRGKFDRFDVSVKQRMLDMYGIDIVICMYGKADPDINELLYRYIHYPIIDGIGARKDFDYLQWLATEVAEYIDDGHCVLSHCNGGRNRSGLINALIVRELLDLTGKAALEYVQMKRPNAIATPVFREFLESLDVPYRNECRLVL